MKKCFLLLLMLITLVAGTALAQGADGQMPQVIPYPEGLDIKSEGASAAPPEINHQPSRYFTALDYYNMQSNDNLTILSLSDLPAGNGVYLRPGSRADCAVLLWG